jgi:hypothetical protein
LVPDQTELPTAEEFFGPAPPAPTADEFFGPREDVERQRYRMINEGTIQQSPLKDFLFSEQGPVGTAFHSAGRIVRAFGEGFTEAGPATGLSDESKEQLKQWTGADKWSETHRKIAKAATNVLLDPVAYDWALVTHALSGVQRGAQAAVVQAGREIGQEKLARDIAAIPEAFPTFEFRMGMPSRAVAEAGRLRMSGVEPGEAAARQRAIESFEPPRLPPEQAEPMPASPAPRPAGMPGGAIAEAIRTYAELPPEKMRLDPLREIEHARALGVIGPSGEGGWVFRGGGRS